MKYYVAQVPDLGRMVLMAPSLDDAKSDVALVSMKRNFTVAEVSKNVYQQTMNSIINGG